MGKKNLSLLDKVESFLADVKYISFACDTEVKMISLLFDKDGFKSFSKVSNYTNLIEYFEGTEIKFVISTNAANTAISFVDTKNGDTVNFKNAKFINGNVHKFFASNIPFDTVFLITMIGKSADNTTMLLPPPVLSIREPLKIHGYSVTDNRSK